MAPDITFRTPAPPSPIEPFDLSHPLVPHGLDGLTILHISDLHVRRNLLHTDRYRTILHALEQTPADLIVLTGDIMDEPGHERAALDTLHALAAAWRTRLGAFAIFGNHDTPDFQRAALREFPHIHWIGNRAISLSVPPLSVPPVARPCGLPVPGAPLTQPAQDSQSPPPPATLRLLGLDWPEDPLRVFLAGAQDSGSRTQDSCFTLALAHHPTSLIPAAEFNIPILLAGHTHGGQIRLHPRLAPHTSSDLPPHLAAGILQLRTTLCCISRGLGDGVVEHLRINCPRQIPLYTLRRAPLPSKAESVRQILAW